MNNHTSTQSITVQVPATTANIGPGYDIWGLSLKLYNIFHVEYQSLLINESSEFSTSKVQFVYSKSVRSFFDHEEEDPLDEYDNLFIKSYELLFRDYDKVSISIQVRADINIPLERGLGSSATAIIGGLVTARVILEEVYGEIVAEQDLLQLAVKIEGHPDNVAPCLFGGFVISMMSSSLITHSQRCTIQAPVILFGVVPKIKVSTSDARKVVSHNVSLDTLIFHSSRTAIVANLLQNPNWLDEDYLLFQEAMQDKIHEKQRSALIPGMLETFTYWRELGCLSPFLSGSGSTLLGFWRKNDNYTSLELDRIYKKMAIHAEIIIFGDLSEPVTFRLLH